jgi:hypothetical protein
MASSVTCARLIPYNGVSHGLDGVTAPPFAKTHIKVLSSTDTFVTSRCCVCALLCLPWCPVFLKRCSCRVTSNPHSACSSRLNVRYWVRSCVPGAAFIDCGLLGEEVQDWRARSRVSSDVLPAVISDVLATIWLHIHACNESIGTGRRT